MNLDYLRSTVLAAGQASTVDAVLKILIDGLAGLPNTALARIWMMGLGDICGVCPVADICPEKTRCLHLAASSGGAMAKDAKDRRRIDGERRRIPLNVKKIGYIGGTGNSLLIDDITKNREWIEDSAWIAGEKIESFAGFPLIFRGEVLGALALFSREKIGEHGAASLRAFADHAALAIGNARRFEESEWLKRRSEEEIGRRRVAVKREDPDRSSGLSEANLKSVDISEDEAEHGADFISEEEWKRLWKNNILAALKRSGGKLYGSGGAAELLGIKPTTLASQMKALGIERRTADGADGEDEKIE